MPDIEDLRRDYPDIAPDFTIPQRWEHYNSDEHAVWQTLFEHQAKLLPGRACDAFLTGLAKLDLSSDRIPDFERLSDRLEKETGWRVVAVPSLTSLNRTLLP